MAVFRDHNFKRSLSVPETALVAAAPPPGKAEDSLDFVEEKRRLLNIDLNAPPEDDDYDSPLEVNDKNVEVSVGSERYSDFVDEIGSGKAADLSVRNCEKRIDKTLSHCVRLREDSEIDNLKEQEEKAKEIIEIDSILIRRWKALLHVTEIALREYEHENLGREETRMLSQNRKTSRESELGGEWSTKKKKTVCGGSGGVGDVVEVVVSPPPVVRSSRGRTVALPNKFKDSFLGNVVAPEFPRRNRSGKSASTIAAVNRKSR